MVHMNPAPYSILPVACETFFHLFPPFCFHGDRMFFFSSPPQDRRVLPFFFSRRTPVEIVLFFLRQTDRRPFSPPVHRGCFIPRNVVRRKFFLFPFERENVRPSPFYFLENLPRALSLLTLWSDLVKYPFTLSFRCGSRRDLSPSSLVHLISFVFFLHSFFSRVFADHAK